MIRCSADCGLFGRGIVPAAIGCLVPQFIRRQASRHGTGECTIARILVRGIGRCALRCMTWRGSFLIVLPTGGLGGTVLRHALPFRGRLSAGLLYRFRVSLALCTAPTIRLLPGLLLIDRSKSKYPGGTLFGLFRQRFQTQVIVYCPSVCVSSRRGRYCEEISGIRKASASEHCLLHTPILLQQPEPNRDRQRLFVTGALPSPELPRAMDGCHALLVLLLRSGHNSDE